MRLGQALTRPGDPGGLLPLRLLRWWGLPLPGWVAGSGLNLPAGPANHKPAKQMK